MAGTINIRRDVTDPFYRYKMEKLQSKIEGKGNGIKSVVVNLSSVANSLSRDPAYVVKFFGFELGAQVTANPSDDRYIINGAHDAAKLQDYLDTFINKFVLCAKCKNPETDLMVQRDGRILRDCKACGQRTDVDLRHKLSGYITKNPPKQAKTQTISSIKGEKKPKKNGKKDSSKDRDEDSSPKDSGSEEADGAPEAGSDDELTREIKSAAEKMNDLQVQEDDWGIDMSEEAVKARARGLSENMARVALDGDADEEADNPYNQLGVWVQEQKNDNDGSVNPLEVYKKAAELGIEKKHRTLQVLAQTLFDKNMIKEKQIDKYAALLKKMITSDRHEKALLGGTERFVGIDHPELIKHIPAILMAYYENDLVTEDTITNWGTKASKKYVEISVSRKVRKAAEPFLKWLEEADSDEEESDEEESDDE